jgi:hypothetical protein
VISEVGITIETSAVSQSLLESTNSILHKEGSAAPALSIKRPNIISVASPEFKGEYAGARLKVVVVPLAV